MEVIKGQYLRKRYAVSASMWLGIFMGQLDAAGLGQARSGFHLLAIAQHSEWHGRDLVKVRWDPLRLACSLHDTPERSLQRTWRSCCPPSCEANCKASAR